MTPEQQKLFDETCARSINNGKSIDSVVMKVDVMESKLNDIHGFLFNKGVGAADVPFAVKLKDLSDLYEKSSWAYKTLFKFTIRSSMLIGAFSVIYGALTWFKEP